MYYLIKCPNCKFMFITRASKRVKCPVCKRSMSVEKYYVAKSRDPTLLRWIMLKNSGYWIRYKD